ncbi:MAG TPA: histidine kinase [Thermoanaerobaculia bacterium]|nr:histidine kinase [Thermoanaerobaculia bacterium]
MTPRSATWLGVTIFWTLFGLMTGLQVWFSMMGHGHSVPRLIGYHIVVWESWVAISVGIAALVHRYPAVNLRNVLVHILSATLFAVLHIAYWIAMILVLHPFDPLPFGWPEISVIGTLGARLPLELILYTAVAGAAHAIEYYTRSRALELSLARSQLHALELQIQPHFLFNTLNTISALVRSDRSRDAVTMIAGLSDLLRYMLDRADQQLVPLDDEGRMLERYLEIQRMRFPDRLTYTIDLAPDVRDARVPVLILQPLAENAIRHGVAMSSGAGVVNVRAFRDDQHLQIEMFNSGRLADGAGRGIGLRNTRERLEQLYRGRQTFSLTNAVDGVLAKIILPLEPAHARGDR